MRWSGQWLILGCLLITGGSLALPSCSESTVDAKTLAQGSHGVFAGHGNVAAIDDAEADPSEWFNGVLSQTDAPAAPPWQHVFASPANWRHDCVAFPTTRRGTAPLLVGIVELLI